MQGFRALTIFLLSIAVAMGSVTVSIAGDGPTLQGKWHEGRIASITIDRCGVEPGQCIGSIVLAEQSIGEVALGIRPGTWIKQAIASSSSRIYAWATMSACRPCTSPATGCNR